LASIQTWDSQQRRAGRNALAHLHGALRHDAVHRRHDPHMAQRDDRGAQLRDGRQHVRIVIDIDAGDARPGLRQAAARRIHRTFRRRDRVAGMRQLLARHRPPQGAAAALIILARAGKRDIGLGQLGAVGIGAGKCPAHPAHSARQIGLGRLPVDLSDAGIHFDQDLTAFDSLRIVGVQRRHGGVLAAGHRHDIARHIGIVRGFMVARPEQPVQAPDHSGGQHDRAQDQESLAAAFGARGGGGCLTHGLAP
jgi:hypothetical protein